MLILLLIGVICIIGHCNRVPFDLAEAESELVAGFIVEYSGIYFSIIMLCEYSNVIMLLVFIIGLFNLI